MDSHVSREELKAYRVRELDTERRRRIKLHLDTCQQCFEEFKDLAAIDFIRKFVVPYVEHLRRTTVHKTHPSEKTIKELCDGKIKDLEKIDQLAGHFLRYKECDDKLEEMLKKLVAEEKKS